MKRILTETKFFRISYDPKDKSITSNIEKDVELAYERCFKFFKRKPSQKINIIICNNNKEFKKEAKYYYSSYATGLVLRNLNIIIKSPDLIEKENKWKRKDFVDILTHEMTHSFWYSFLKVWTPNWLSEGLACYLSKHFLLQKDELKSLINKKGVDFAFIDFKYLPKKISYLIEQRYQLWSNFTKYLIEKYGKNKILEFLNKYSKDTTKQNYENLFQFIYKKTVKELYQEFVRSL